ncbi:hypothetical protein NQ318_001527 [Aromia moschata]|uniref:Transposase n=1 Tax=Aromia moschata TaxID=1265417 RepID=A0AAV8X5I8_9CUCU|nr:hypothetical protein NQ318_001527 [Aromia moschata]
MISRPKATKCSCFQRPGRRNNHENAILRTFDNNPRLSSRRAALRLETSKSTVLRVLHKDNRKPYHLQHVQNLLPGDENCRMTFCNWLLDSIGRNPEFLQTILWIDEVTFTRTEIFNHHNCHFIVNVWVGLINGYVIGPFFLPPRLNANLFLNFLTNHLFDLFDEVIATQMNS